MPMREGLVFVRNALIGINARDRIRVGCSGKIINGFDMARTMALGANWCNAARGFMFSLGCIQSMSCHTDRCPTGVTTQNPTRARALVVADKTERVRNYHASMLQALAELTAAAGLDHPHEFRPEHFSRRVNAHETMTFAELYPSLKRGELVTGAQDKRWREMWEMVQAEFVRAGRVLRALQFDDDAVGVLDEALAELGPGHQSGSGIANLEAVEPGEHGIERVEREGHVIDGIARVLRLFSHEVEMDGGLGAVIEPSARKAEIWPPSVGEADRVGIEGDRALEVRGPNVHVLHMNGHIGLRLAGAAR